MYLPFIESNIKITTISTGLISFPPYIRLRSHRNIRYAVYGLRYTLFGIRYMLYGHGGSHRSSTCFQCALFVSMKKVANSLFCKDMNSSEEEYSALLAEEEGTLPKKNRCILVRQHFEMRPVLVEFNTTFQNLINFFSHPLSLKTWKLSDMHALFIINTSKLYPF